MRQHRFTALGLALAFVLGACGSEPDEFSAPDPEDAPVAEQAPADAPADGDEDDDIPEAEPFESPVVEEDDVMTAAPSGLISSTNPQERSRQVQRNLDAVREGNGDPFGVLQVEVSRSQQQANAVAEEGGGSAAGVGAPLPHLTPQTAASLPDFNATEFAVPRLRPSGSVTTEELEDDDIPLAEAPSSDGIPSAEAPTPSPDAGEPAPDPTPPPPAIDLAEGTEVTGVIQVGGDIQIILQTPGSAFSRYVRVGDTIANGEVRVVRVERLSGEPIVILEQNGVEVARGVGEPAIRPNDDDMANWITSR